MPRVTRSSRNIGKRFTVDIEVANSHSYQLNNGIKVHNTVSLLAGATPGIHYPESNYYIRRVRLKKDSDMLPGIIAAGYKVEPCKGSEETTVVVEIPICVDEPGLRTNQEVSLWEQVLMAVSLQKYWADNQVSVTLTFDKEKEGKDIEKLLKYFQKDLKAVSFLPRVDHGAYPQMPYEAISKEKFEELSKNIKPLHFDIRDQNRDTEVELDKYCDGDKCVL